MVLLRDSCVLAYITGEAHVFLKQKDDSDFNII